MTCWILFCAVIASICASLYVVRGCCQSARRRTSPSPFALRLTRSARLLRRWRPWVHISAKEVSSDVQHYHSCGRQAYLDGAGVSARRQASKVCEEVELSKRLRPLNLQISSLSSSSHRTRQDLAFTQQRRAVLKSRRAKSTTVRHQCTPRAGSRLALTSSDASSFSRRAS